MHLRLLELASPLHSTAYPSIEISEATLDTSIHCFSNYLKTQFVRSYSNTCNINDCLVCNNSNKIIWSYRVHTLFIMKAEYMH